MWVNGQTRASTAEHKAWVREVMRSNREQHEGRCEVAGPNCTGRAEHADHRVAVAEGGDEFDPANGQGACEACHEAKSREEQRRGHAAYYALGKRRPQRHPLETLLQNGEA